MPNLISATLTSTNKNDIATHIDNIKFICSFIVNLTPKDRQKIYKMGKKSVAFVSGVLKALIANPSIVPASFSVSEFEKDYRLYLDLQFVLTRLRPLVEGLEDTLLLLCSELMKQGSSGYKIIKQSAKADANMDTMAKELGIRFKRAARMQPVVHSLHPKQSVTLHGVVPRRLLKTLNASTLTVYRGEVMTGKTQVVGGHSKMIIPVGWTTITIFNNDDVNQSIFSLLQK